MLVVIAVAHYVFLFLFSHVKQPAIRWHALSVSLCVSSFFPLMISRPCDLIFHYSLQKSFLVPLKSYTPKTAH
jgi:hypothetical protein